jgi:hypothetical protein
MILMLVIWKIVTFVTQQFKLRLRINENSLYLSVSSELYRDS